MLKRILVCLLATLLLIGAVGALGEGEVEQFGKGLKIGYSELQVSGSFSIRQRESVYAEAEKYGFQIVFADAQGTITKQLADLEDFVAQGVDFIIVHAVDKEGLDSAVQQAKQAGIPIVLVARGINGVAGEDYACYICSDGIWEGLAGADAIAQKLNGSAKVIELQGMMGTSIAVERSTGFAQGLALNPGLELVAQQTANFTRTEAQKVTENLIQSTDGDFDAIFAANDEMALGALQAVKAAGLSDKIIIGIDGQVSAMDAIRDGELYATITHSPYTGPWAIEVIRRIIKGEEVPIQITRQEYVVTLENVEEFYDRAI
jgi:ABC-type sugar transport system substrate-binding protein